MLEHLKNRIAFVGQTQKRPFIAVSYAQSIDGCIASRKKEPIRLSGPKSMQFTHQLRTCFDAILVGIGTVLTDNPRLDSRLADGRNPQPIVLDTHLRTPVNAALVRRTDKKCWIICGDEGESVQSQRPFNSGVAVLPCKIDDQRRIDLPALIKLLSEKQIGSVMVEGGARVITSFINRQLVDQFIITISPKLLGGLPVVDQRGIGIKPYLPMNQIDYQRLGDDMVLWAVPEWNSG